MVPTLGRINPSWLLVCALKPLQNSMMLTPCWPSAGPTGGDGFALPAGFCSSTIAWTFCTLEPLHLVVLELDGGGPAEDRHLDLHPPALGIHVLHDALEVDERSVDDADLVAPLEDRLRLRLLRPGLHLPQDVVHLVLRERDRLVPRADETGHLGRRAHQVPRLLGQLHPDQHVAREELLPALALLLVPDLDHLLGRHEHAGDLLGHPEDLGARLDRLLHLVLEARVGVDDEPLLAWRRGRRLAAAHLSILSTTRASTMSTAPRKKATTTVTTITTTVELTSS